MNYVYKTEKQKKFKKCATCLLVSVEFQQFLFQNRGKKANELE